MRVLFVTSEFEDYVRVGGLAAVSAALPRALHGQFGDVRVLLPGYSDVLSQLSNLQTIGKCEAFAGLPESVVARSDTSDGLPVYVLICPKLYERPGTPYGDPQGHDWPDNDIRFARLASAAAILANGEVDLSWKADLLHANDWPSALAPAYLAWRGIRLPSVLTIHNLAYQGLFSKSTMQRIGAPDSAFHIDGIEFYDQTSFLKAGIVHATHLTTVSETYAREITTPEHGCGLEGLLRRRSEAGDLTGILNGIDESWGAPVAIFCRLSRPENGRARRRTRTASAANSGSRCLAARCSRWSRGLCIKRGLISFCRPRRPLPAPVARSS